MKRSKSTNPINDLAADGMQYITFIIGEETYGVSVHKVQEIVGMMPITQIPNTLSFVKGVINLRGSVVPVIDIRTKFNMPELKYSNTTVIIIVEVQSRLVGMIVDAVSDVLTIPEDDLQDAPNYTAKIEIDFIESIARKDEDLIIILDTERVLSSDEFDMLESKKNINEDKAEEIEQEFDINNQELINDKK